MPNSQLTDYLGYAITTRWAELEQATGTRCPSFGASFCVVPPDSREASWQAFPKEVFTTRVAAAANSRMAAMLSVEDDIAAHRRRDDGIHNSPLGDLSRSSIRSGRVMPSEKIPD